MGSVVLTGATSGSTTITPTDGVTATVTLPSTGGTLQTSGAGFTTNGVAYASSTSALTTGSGLTFDGTNLGIGIASPTQSWTGGSAKVQQLQGVSSQVTVLRVNEASGTYGDLQLVSSGSAEIGVYNFANGALRFGTNGTERMRINSSGNLLLGTSSPTFGSGNAKMSILFDGSAINGINIKTSYATNGSQFIAFYNSSDSQIGYITQNASNTVNYSTSSDYRLKNTIAPMTGALAKVAQLKPVTYKWKVDGSDGQGFIAHELAEVVPDCVTGEKDAVDADGNPKYQGIDTSFLVATLTSAIQELSTLITAQQSTIQSLTARLTALENK
jgi:hypothetical protein